MNRHIIAIAAAAITASVSLATPGQAQTDIDTRTGTSRLERTEVAIGPWESSPDGRGQIFTVSEFTLLTQVSVFLYGFSGLSAQPFQLFLSGCQATDIAPYGIDEFYISEYEGCSEQWFSDVRMTPAAEGVFQYTFDVDFGNMLFASEFFDYLLEFRNLGTELLWVEYIRSLEPLPDNPSFGGMAALQRAPFLGRENPWETNPWEDVSVMMTFSDPFASTVPEPASIALVATGLIALGGAARRKRKK